MSFWEEYETDRDSEIKGVWKTFKGGLELRIARADASSNPIFAKTYQAIMADVDMQDETASADALLRLYASTVTDAKNLVDRDGAVMPCTPETIYNLFLQLPELYKEIRAIALDFDNYKLVNVAETLGKSPNGVSPGEIKKVG